MKDIIKEVLREQANELAEVMRISDVDKEDFVQWGERGLTPYVLLEDTISEFTFREMTLGEVSALSVKYRGLLRVFPLTQKQAELARKFAGSIIDLIDLKLQYIKGLKQQFKGVLVHKLMKNDFGTSNTPDTE